MEPLPISREELNALLEDPKTLIRRMVLSFVLERPRQVRVGRPPGATAKTKKPAKSG